MAQDSDVARVAAALHAPGLRYRSFGNEPVRAARLGSTTVDETYPLLGAHGGATAESSSLPGSIANHDLAPAPTLYVATLVDPVAYPPLPHSYSPPAPDQAAAPMLLPMEFLAPAAVSEPVSTEVPQLVSVANQPQVAPLPPAAGVAADFAASVPQPPAVAPTAPVLMELPAPVAAKPASAVEPPSFILAPAAALAPSQPPVSYGGSAYNLLEVLGRQLDLGPSIADNTAMPSLGTHHRLLQTPDASASHDVGSYSQSLPGGPVPGGTFASLLAGVNNTSATGQEVPNHATAGAAVAPRPASVLPAAAVTISLPEVLQLVAARASTSSSPFDALRVAVHAPESR